VELGDLDSKKKIDAEVTINQKHPQKKTKQKTQTPKKKKKKTTQPTPNTKKNQITTR